MSIRLTTGFCRGMNLESPPEGTRPTAGKVRSAVWNSLQNLTPGARVLDVYAGSGAVGIEALSRGAALACFVESGADAVRSLRTNLKEVERRGKVLPTAPIIRIFATTAIKALPQQPDAAFDILWFDPPYKLLPDHWPHLAPHLDRIGAEGAVIVVESDGPGADFLKSWSAGQDWNWNLERQKTYGSVAVSFFERRSAQ